MRYLIGAAVAIFVVVKVVRAIAHGIAEVGRGIAAVASAVAGGIADAAAAVATFFVVVVPWLIGGVLVGGLLWVLSWLIAESGYWRKDRLRHRAWFDGVASQVAVAVAPGGPLRLTEPTPSPPRYPVFGAHAEHRWVPPVPSALERRVVAVSCPAGAVESTGTTSAAAADATDVGAQVGGLNQLDPVGQVSRVREFVEESVCSRVTEWAVDVPGEIEVGHDVHGLQIGKGNRQYNFYSFVVVTPKINLADRLQDVDVRAATKRVAEDPTDESARQALLRKLAPGGLGLGGPTSELRVTSVRSKFGGPGSWLGNLLLLQDTGEADITGVQTGDYNTQHNKFVYAVTPTGDASVLLRNDRDLAKALIDCAFPTERGHDQNLLDAALRDALGRTPVNPADGVERSAHHDAPGPGTVLTIQSADGVSVGEGSTVRSVTNVETPVDVHAGDVATYRLPRAEAPTRSTQDMIDDAIAFSRSLRQQPSDPPSPSDLPSPSAPSAWGRGFM